MKNKAITAIIIKFLEREEEAIYFNLQKITRFFSLVLFVLFVASFVRYPDYVYLSLALFILLSLDIYCRWIQTKRTLLSNFGVLAFFRYVFENLGPGFRQYFFSNDTEERPFSRVERSAVYRKSKDVDKDSSFGSLLQFDSTELKLKHSFFPHTGGVEPFSLCFGEERNLKQKYQMKSPLLISGMSFGSLGQNAVRALARGAKKAGIIMNTGEGGYPKYHLMEGADLIFQIGTAKFGVQKKDGTLDPSKLESISKLDQVKMIEIKFSQGGKPAKGGILPKEKVTKEISDLRGIPMGQDAISPERHIECKDSESTVQFIKQVQEISQLPVGIKFCLGREDELKDLFLVMKKTNTFPDYIALDGSEGGTGAAPKVFMDDLGFSVLQALNIVRTLIEELEIKGKFKILCAGKLVDAGKQVMVLSLGAHAIYTARGFLLALGCIQSLKCHTNACPTGITTHNPKLTRGLDIEEKSERVKNYALNLIKIQQDLVRALGLKSFSELNKNHVINF